MLVVIEILRANLYHFLQVGSQILTTSHTFAAKQSYLYCGINENSRAKYVSIRANKDKNSFIKLSIEEK